MMVSCQEVIRELWDYLDGELPAERAAAIADHLAECARCYPQYRFEYAFLSAVTRQRVHAPGPSAALVEKIAAVVLRNERGARSPAQLHSGANERRPTPRAASPLLPRGAALGSRVRIERWALAILRASLGVFLLVGIGRLAVPSSPLNVVGVLEGVLGAFILFGVGRRWSYAAALLVHVGSLLFFWGQLRDPWAVALAGLPVCGALVALYLLRDRDAWALDAWLAMRRPWSFVR